MLNPRFSPNQNPNIQPPAPPQGTELLEDVGKASPKLPLEPGLVARKVPVLQAPEAHLTPRGIRHVGCYSIPYSICLWMCECVLHIICIHIYIYIYSLTMYHVWFGFVCLLIRVSPTLFWVCIKMCYEVTLVSVTIIHSLFYDRIT